MYAYVEVVGGMAGRLPNALHARAAPAQTDHYLYWLL